MKVKIFSNEINSQLWGLETEVNTWLAANQGKVDVKDTNVGFVATTGGYKYAMITIWYDEVTVRKVPKDLVQDIAGLHEV